MRIPAVFLAGSVAACASHGHGHHPGGAHGSHGNPADLDAYVARLDESGRDAWQKPDEVLAALSLREGDRLCDIGAGTGYFALRAARLVGATGTVFAVDVEPRMLAELRERLQKTGLRNVVPVLSLPDEPLLPPASCDVILVVDTYHHFPDGPAYLQRLVRALRPGGRLVNVDFHKRALPVGPPVDHLVSREAFLADAGRAGLRLVAEHTFLPHQYFVVLEPQG